MLRSYKLIDRTNKSLLGCLLLAASFLFEPVGLSGVDSASACKGDSACILFVNLTSVNPTRAELDDIKARLETDGYLKTAYHIINTQKEFQTVRLKGFAEPWSQKDGKIGAILDDTSATIILSIINEIDFRRILYDDIIAVGSGEVNGNASDKLKLPNGEVIDGYARGFAGKDHYRMLEELEVYHIPGFLSFTSQLPYTHQNPAAVSGILSTWGFGNAAYSAGTNRRAIPMITREALCIDLDALRDSTGVEKYTRRDLIKTDADDTNTTWRTVCKTCHTGPLEQWSTAFIYHDVRNQAVVWERVEPVPANNKMNRVGQASGYVPKNAEWFNELTDAQMKLIGFTKDVKGGFGLKSLGRALSETESFKSCQPQKAFKAVCGRDPDENDQGFLNSLVKDFETSKYNLKRSFAKSAIYCAGGSE